MRALNPGLWAVLSTVLFFHTTPSLAQTVCHAAEVKLGDNYIQVAPTGSDDTENIQCALDLAVEKRISEIRLTQGEFFIGSLSVQDFVGTLQGGGKDHTRLTVLDQSVDCAASAARGEATAAMKFIGGEPRIRWLTLSVGSNIWPCATGEIYGGLDAMIHFTGRRGSEACTTAVIYGTIDRVNLEGPRIYGLEPKPMYTGVLTDAEQSGDPGCRNTLLGSIRINRSLIRGFSTGAWLNLRGNAQVNVLNTDFDGNFVGLRLDDSNALVTIFGNRFASKAPGSYSCCESGGVGIGVYNQIVSTGLTHFDIYGNVFEIRSGGFDSSWGIRLLRNPGATSVGLVATRNHFQLSGGGNLAEAVSSHGVSGGILSDNLFSSYLQGSGLALSVNADFLGEADHWTFVGNRGLADMYIPDVVNNAHVFLGVNSSNALIGPGQAAIIRDEGVRNTLLPQ
jgi:hypothetical protein